MTPRRPLSGKVALVTGGARRIGRAIALALADQGAGVAITFRESSDEAAGTVADLRTRGVDSHAFFCDLRDEVSITETIASVSTLFGRLDILVNNAGSFESVPLEKISREAWEGMFATNTLGPYLMAKAALPHLRQSLGRIINIGSLGGTHAWATHGHYCTTKAALHMLSQTMAKAWAPDVSVNCIAPGMIVQGEAGPGYEHFAEKTPMKRNGTADDVAAAAVFFATGPRFITGQVLGVDGGLGL